MTFLKQLYMFRTTNSLTLRSTFWLYIHLSVGTALAQWLRCCVTNRKVAGSIPDGVIWIFHWHKIHYGPGVDSPSNRDEYQEYFLGGKGGRCVRLATLPPSCAVVMKSGNLNFLEPSGPLQACNGTALPLLNITSVCLYFYLSYPTGNSHLFCAVLSCHLWPVWPYCIFPHLIIGSIF